MATLSAKFPTLADWANFLDPDGKAATVVEILSQTNPILTDMVTLEANNVTTHKSVIRTGLPSGTWRKLYQGVDASKSTRATVEDGIGMLEARSEVDKDLAELNGLESAFRLDEAQAHLEGMNQTMASTLFYGDSTTEPEKFTGLAPRYSSLSAGNAQNIIDGGGTGSDNMSVWLVVWGKNTIHGIFPKGSKAGLTQEDLGLADAFDSSSRRYRAYMEHFQWKCGIALRDWRYVVRICNIDASNLVAESSAADVIKLMTKAVHRIPNMAMGKACFYVNPTLNEMLDIQAQGKATYTLMTGNDAAGQPMTSFRGIPIRSCDALLSTEARVT
jgi:hypothetical protein